MKKILVIEHLAETRNLWLKWLKAEGFNTISTENGLSGIQLAHQELPDLIISEVMLPKLDDYGVLTLLRQNPVTATIPLIFVSAKVNRTDIRKGMELGADDYLTKPCMKGELLRAIAACLEQRAMLQKCYGAKSEVDIIKPIVQASIFPSYPHLSEIFYFIEANYHLPITLGDVANEVGYNPAYLTNLVRRQTGKTLQTWIILRRMAAARSLLLETDQKVEAIAAKIGYQSIVHFYRQFRKYHQTTPQAWRKSQRTNHKQQQKS